MEERAADQRGERCAEERNEAHLALARARLLHRDIVLDAGSMESGRISWNPSDSIVPV